MMLLKQETPEMKWRATVVVGFEKEDLFQDL